MSNFSVGIVSVVFTIAFPILYVVFFQLRRLGAWSKREKAPGDRVGFFVVVFALFGFVAGSFAQPLWEVGAECKSAGKPVVPCVLSSSFHG